jgi:uncharacterized protein YbbC (DUF1343 family)
MAKITQIFLLFFCCLLFSCQKGEKLKLGAERTDSYLPLLKEKKIAIVGNQSSTISSTHLVDSLLSLEVDVVKVFSPEHGFRGIADAGTKVKDGIDVKTGIPIISLYGKNRKPQKKAIRRN